MLATSSGELGQKLLVWSHGTGQFTAGFNALDQGARTLARKTAPLQTGSVRFAQRLAQYQTAISQVNSHLGEFS